MAETEETEGTTTAGWAPMSEEEIRQLAIDIDAGAVFLSTDPEETRMCFMCLVFGDEEFFESLTENDVVGFWEHMSKAGPRSCNGKPQFFSAHALIRGDFERLRKAHEELKAFKKGGRQDG